jgi:hypothetical protein
MLGFMIGIRLADGSHFCCGWFRCGSPPIRYVVGLAIT